MAFKKLFSATLTTLLFCSLALSCFSFAQAQSLPTPSVPEFTVKFTILSQDIPEVTPTYTIDPYTGQQKIQNPGSSGYHEEKRAVEIKVKNQPYVAHVDGSNYVALFYNVSYKGPYENDWHYYHRTEQSTSDYTLINFTDVPNDGGTIEFRVQAQIGYYTQYYMPFVDYAFHGEVSGWSSLQSVDVTEVSQSSSTATLPASTAYPTAPSNTSGAPESDMTSLLIGGFAGLGIVVALLVVVIALLSRKIRVLERKLAN